MALPCTREAWADCVCTYALGLGKPWSLGGPGIPGVWTVRSLQGS